MNRHTPTQLMEKIANQIIDEYYSGKHPDESEPPHVQLARFVLQHPPLRRVDDRYDMFQIGFYRKQALAVADELIFNDVDISAEALKDMLKKICSAVPDRHPADLSLWIGRENGQRVVYVKIAPVYMHKEDLTDKLMEKLKQIGIEAECTEIHVPTDLRGLTTRRSPVVMRFFWEKEK